MADNDPQKTIEERIKKDKETLIEQFRKSPVVQVACEKCGIGRTTYYRWHNEDIYFASKADKALEEGVFLINDLAVSKLIQKISEGDFNAIKYWLSHNHPKFENRLSITPAIKETTELPEEVIKEVDRLFAINSRCSDCGKNILPSTTKGTE